MGKRGWLERVPVWKIIKKNYKISLSGKFYSKK